MSTPPSSTPTAPPEPATAPQTPSARLRSAPSAKVVVRIDERGGREDRRAEALERARRDQLALAGRQAAEQRGEREEDEADGEDAAAAEQVGHAPAEQQEAAEDERVGVDDPGQVLLGEVEVAADRRQRDIDDRGVEDDDELGRGEQGECEALSRYWLLTGSRGVPSCTRKVEAEFRLRSRRYGIEVPLVNPYSCERVARHRGAPHGPCGPTRAAIASASSRRPGPCSRPRAATRTSRTSRAAPRSASARSTGTSRPRTRCSRRSRASSSRSSRAGRSRPRRSPIRGRRSTR